TVAEVGRHQDSTDTNHWCYSTYEEAPLFYFSFALDELLITGANSLRDRPLGAGADVLAVDADDADDPARGPGDEHFLRREEVIVSRHRTLNHESCVGGHCCDRAPGRVRRFRGRDADRAVGHYKQPAFRRTDEAAGTDVAVVERFKQRFQ